jgi:hypothetical protein
MPRRPSTRKAIQMCPWTLLEALFLFGLKKKTRPPVISCVVPTHEANKTKGKKNQKKKSNLMDSWPILNREIQKHAESGFTVYEILSSSDKG